MNNILAAYGHLPTIVNLTSGRRTMSPYSLAISNILNKNSKSFTKLRYCKHINDINEQFLQF